jgi:LysM repeat protein
MLLGNVTFAQSSVIKNYIEQYQNIAVEEMLRTGVPAAIKLAQGIHETEAGRSNLVLRSNNHFGIKCKSTWTGESVSHDDDAKGECFRKYQDAFDSYRDHSNFLRSNARYASLFELDPTDYEGWAMGLKNAGYATNPKYPQIIIKIINDYQLQDYTLLALNIKNGNSSEMLATRNKQQGSTSTRVKQTYPEGVFKINETNVVFVSKGTSYLAVAEKHGIALKRLFDFNDIQQQESTPSDQLIYLQRKRKTGANEFHKVVAGESLNDIAQVEGIRLESLMEYNFLKNGMQPEAGEILYLQNRATARPKIITQLQQIIASIEKSIFPDPEKISSNRIDDTETVHIVQPKETLYSIAKKYTVSMEDVVKWNELPSTDLRSGQQLRIKKNM